MTRINTDDPAEIVTDGGVFSFKHGQLMTCADNPSNTNGGNGNAGDIIIGSSQITSEDPACLRIIPFPGSRGAGLLGGQNVPVVRMSRDGVVNIGQPATVLLQPNESWVLSPKTVGMIIVSTSGATALFLVHTPTESVVLDKQVGALFSDVRGGAALCLYYESHPLVLGPVLTNTSDVARKVGITSLGGG